MQSEADNQEQQPLIVLPGGVGVYTSSVAEELRIDSEFQSLIPPLSKGEKAALQASILEEGCLNPLVVWAEKKASHRRSQQVFYLHRAQHPLPNCRDVFR